MDVPLFPASHLTVLLREQVEACPQPSCGTWVPAMTLQEAGAGLLPGEAFCTGLPGKPVGAGDAIQAQRASVMQADATLFLAVWY